MLTVSGKPGVAGHATGGLPTSAQRTTTAEIAIPSVWAGPATPAVITWRRSSHDAALQKYFAVMLVDVFAAVQSRQSNCTRSAFEAVVQSGGVDGADTPS